MAHLVEFTYQLPSGQVLQMDAFNALYRRRIMMINQKLTLDFANYMVPILLYMENENKDKPIMIMPVQGECDAMGCMCFYDTLKYIQCPVGTIAGMTPTGMMAFLMGAGDKGRRFMYPNQIVNLVSPSTQARGQAADISNEARQLERLDSYVTSLFADYTGESLAKVRSDFKSNKILTPWEAREYGKNGIVDHIITIKKVPDSKNLRYSQLVNYLTNEFADELPNAAKNRS